jgi:outer membrane protein insertion porin family
MRAPKIMLGALLVLALAACAVAPLSASDLEQERPHIGSISFVGNENISGGKLKSIMRTREPRFFQLFNKPRFRPDFLRYDLAAIEAFYHKNGYYEVSARVLEQRIDDVRHSMHIVIGISEGPQTLVGGVRLEGDIPFDASEITKGLLLKRDAPFDSTRVGRDVYFIRNRMWDRGYVLSDILSTMEISDHRAFLTYTVDAGPRMYVGEIDVAGNKVTGEKRVREQLTFKPGELFSLKKMQDSQQYLFDTSLFRQVKLTPTDIDTVKNTIGLLVEVEERKMSYLEMGLGVGTEDNGRILAEWGHRHTPWLGGKLQIDGEFAFDVFRDGEAQFSKRFSRAGAAYTGPRFPGTRFQTSVDGFYEQDRNPQTVNYDIWGFGVHGRRRVGRTTVLYLDFTDEFVKREIPDSVAVGSNIFTRESDETRSLGLTLDRDARDNLLYPTRGSQRSLSFEVAGGPLRGENHFVRLVGSLSYYRRAWSGITFAARARTGVAAPYGRSNDGKDPDGIPFEHRFYGGGSNSVRGYKENSLGPRIPPDDPGALNPEQAALRGDAEGGEVIILTNVEMRFPIWRRIQLGGVLFMDGGNVWANPSDIRLDDFVPARDMEGGGYTDENVTKYRYSLGFGLRYNTPIGPLRIDYGVPVSRTGEIDSFGMFHFNLGHAF